MAVATVVVASLLVPSVTTSAADPLSVTLVGSLQSELGCGGDWQADCADYASGLRRRRRRLARHVPGARRQLGIQGGDQRLVRRELRPPRPTEWPQHPAQPGVRRVRQVLLRPQEPLDHRQPDARSSLSPPEVSSPSWAAQAIGIRAAFGPGCRTRTATVSTRSRRPRCRLARTRARSPSTKAGTRTTVKVESPGALTSHSPCRRTT